LALLRSRKRIELLKDLSAGDFAVAVDEPKNS
jgi:hypothetical protein